YSRHRLRRTERRVAHLESGILRQHDGGERPDLAVSDGRTVPLPVSIPERVRFALPHAEDEPRRPAVLADRRRRRPAAGPGASRSAADGAGRARRRDRRLHRRAARDGNPVAQPRTRRAIRRGRARSPATPRFGRSTISPRTRTPYTFTWCSSRSWSARTRPAVDAVRNRGRPARKTR